MSAERSSLFFVLSALYQMRSEFIEKLENLAEPLAAQEELFLVDVEVKPGKELEVWVLVDSEDGGVDLDSCAKISRELGFLLDEKDLMDGAYRLNVASPGLSRPLSDRRQYKKNIGRKAKVKYKENDVYVTAEGELLQVDEQQFVIRPDSGKEVAISFSDVVETKIIPNI